MEARIPERAKKPGVSYAVTDDGIERHPSALRAYLTAMRDDAIVVRLRKR